MKFRVLMEIEHEDGLARVEHVDNVTPECSQSWQVARIIERSIRGIGYYMPATEVEIIAQMVEEFADFGDLATWGERPETGAAQDAMINGARRLIEAIGEYRDEVSKSLD